MRRSASVPVLTLSAPNVLLAALMLASGCAPSVSSPRPVDPERAAGASNTSVRSKFGIVPVADHHVHLLGPSALPPAQPQLPTIDLPDELDRLLRERERIYEHEAGPADLAAVFTPDAQAVSWQRPSQWVRGGDVLAQMVRVIRQPYRFQPNAFKIDGNSGYVAGVVEVGASAQPALDFLLGVTRLPDGSWRIGAENITIKSPPAYGSIALAPNLVADLDDAGIQHGVVLSAAFWLGGRFPDPADEMTREYDAVRAENDWTAQQVAAYPGRLVMACSANVLKRYAVQELERCSRIPQARAFKLHFGDADVDLARPEHLQAVRRFFAAANDHRVPIIVHFSPRRDYDGEYVELFLSQVMSQAPDIVVQIAHLGGDGPGLTSPGGTAAFAAVMEAGDPRAKNLYFDMAGLVDARMSAEAGAAMAARIRQLGLRRVLYASDEVPGMGLNKPTAEHWIQTRRRLPLTAEELRILAGNVAPYLR